MANSERPYSLFAIRHSLDYDAGIAQVLVAVDEIDLPDLDFPAVIFILRKTVAAPARQKPRAVDAELADEEIRAHHAHRARTGGEHLDVGDHPHGAGFRRLRPGIARAQAVDAVLHAPAIVEGDGNLAAGIACCGRSRYPVDAFRHIHRQPFVEAKLIQEPSLALDQHAEMIAHGWIVDRELVLLPVGEALHQVLVELLVDVIGAERGIVGELRAHAHTSL